MNTRVFISDTQVSFITLDVRRSGQSSGTDGRHPTARGSYISNWNESLPGHSRVHGPV
jgi:hypothetical protein